jgi:hypothetical protein
MKTIKINTLILTVIIFLISCSGNFYNVLKENPSSVNLSGYNSIYVGWLDLGPNLYGHAPADWNTENRRHNIDGLQLYLRDALPGKKIFGATSIADQYPGNADLRLQFKLNSKIKYEIGMTIACEFLVDVIYLDGKTGKLLYTSTMLVNCKTAFFAPPQRKFKGNTFDGALDTDIFKLANAIAAKIKSGK